MDNHPLLKILLADFAKFFKEPWQHYIPVFHYIMVNKQQYQVMTNNMLSDRLIFDQNYNDQLVVIYELNNVRWKCFFHTLPDYHFYVAMSYNNLNEVIHICPTDYMNVKNEFMPSRVELLIKDLNQSILDVINNISTATSAPAAAVQLPVTERLHADPQRFDRERIPERVVHAKGGGAFGVFEATDDISDICKAKVFKKGSKTRVLARFSTVAGESGSTDTVRDPRGFAIKMYTEEGIWDLVANNTPIFFVRDPFLFQMFIHSQKRNPQTHLKDPNMVWDFFASNPQATHQFLFLYSDRGVPDGFRHMHGYGSHTFKMVNDKDEFVWVKFHFRTEQGIKNIDPQRAKILAGEQPDYALADLYNAIAKRDYPSWTLYVQVATHEQVQKMSFNPFDLTKVFSQKEFPLRRVGKMILNENPENYFAQIEQAAFSPAHMPPGIEASPDKMLQGRLFSYADTHLHRLGTNYLLIPVNNPETNKHVKVCTYQRDGAMQVGDNHGGCPNYYRNTFHGPDVTNRDKHIEHATFETGMATRHEANDDDNFSQPRIFYQKVLDDRGRAHLIQNIVEHLQQCTDKEIIRRSVAVLANVDDSFGQQLATRLNIDLSHKH